MYNYGQFIVIWAILYYKYIPPFDLVNDLDLDLEHDHENANVVDNSIEKQNKVTFHI